MYYSVTHVHFFSTEADARRHIQSQLTEEDYQNPRYNNVGELVWAPEHDLETIRLRKMDGEL